MKIGAHFLPEDFESYLASVRQADACGYARAWLVDSQMLWEDFVVYMTHGLAATERIVFGSAVCNPATRHWTTTASVHATLAQLHPGRVILGMGRGDSALRTLGLKPVPTAQLAELVPKLRALLAGDEVEGIRLRWASGERVPILMAATGPKNLRTAGALADTVMLQVGTRPESVAWAIERVREGAQDAGRDPDDVEISLLCGMWVGGERAEAEDHTRWAAACAANHLSEVARHSPDHGMPEPLVRLVEARREQYDYYARHLDSSAEHADFLDGEMIDDFAIQGSPQRCLERIRELEALGVGEISSAYLNGCLEQLELVGRELVPALQATPA